MTSPLLVLKQDIKEYLSSFRSLLSRRALFVGLIDAAFYLFAIALSLAMGKVGKIWADSLMGGLGTVSFADAAPAAAAKAVAIKLLLFTFLFFLIIFLGWLVSRGLIWAIIAGKRYTWRFAWRSIIVNAVWLLILAVPIVYLFRGLYQAVQYGPTPDMQIYYWYHLVFFIIVLYLTYLMNYLFTRHERVLITWRDMIVRAVIGLPKMLLPFLLMLCSLVVLVWASKALNFLPEMLSTILGGVLFFASFTWAKMYYHAALTRKLAFGRATALRKRK